MAGNSVQFLRPMILGTVARNYLSSIDGHCTMVVIGPSRWDLPFVEHNTVTALVRTYDSFC